MLVATLALQESKNGRVFAWENTNFLLVPVISIIIVIQKYIAKKIYTLQLKKEHHKHVCPAC